MTKNYICIFIEAEKHEAELIYQARVAAYCCFARDYCTCERVTAVTMVASERVSAGVIYASNRIITWLVLINQFEFRSVLLKIIILLLNYAGFCFISLRMDSYQISCVCVFFPSDVRLYANHSDAVWTVNRFNLNCECFVFIVPMRIWLFTSRINYRIICF